MRTQNAALFFTITQADHEYFCPIQMTVLCISKARRQEYNNYEMGRTEQQEFSLKVSTEKAENVEEGSRLLPSGLPNGGERLFEHGSFAEGQRMRASELTDITGLIKN